MTDANGNRVEFSDRDGIIEQFDPESPYAFSPPEYDSLPKDPPKYLDICGEGHENTAFTEEHEMATTSNADSNSSAEASSVVNEGATSSDSQSIGNESVISESSPEHISQTTVETHNEESQRPMVESTVTGQTDGVIVNCDGPRASSGQVTQTVTEHRDEQNGTARNATADVSANGEEEGATAGQVTENEDQNDSASQVTQNDAAAKREDQNESVVKTSEVRGKTSKNTKKETVTSEQDDVFHAPSTQAQNSVTNISVQSATNCDEISVPAVPKVQTLVDRGRQGSDLSEVDV
jgi:hypothetical protein